MNTNAETFEFQSEARQMLDLMIHSVYSNKDIFLRELISNSSDALDKLRFLALTNKDLEALAADLHIRIETDRDSRTLTVHDNGIGMNRDEVIQFIGTIAKSGSQEFLHLLQESREKGLSPELIGQFGVGFYSCFMVADKVTLITRRAGEEQAWRWESTGDGTYTIEPTEKQQVGTSITLHLKPEDSESALADYLAEWKIREIVKKYSDYVAYPIRFRVEQKEVEKDQDGKPIEGGKEKTVVEDQTLNSMKAIWTRSENEVTDEEYNEFYKHISHDWTHPLKRITLKAEGKIEFRALLFIPSKAPFSLFLADRSEGVHLYIKRVFIMQDCKELLPEYLRFVRGVVDSEDLPLNISREILQQNRQVHVIRNSLTKKVLDSLKHMRKNDNDAYLTFWREFGRIFKEGLFRDSSNSETLFELSLFQSTHSSDELTGLDEYLDRMKDGQDTIYYMTGENRKAVEYSPHLETFREKGYEVLLLVDPVDELWVQTAFEFKGKKLQSVGKGRVDVGTEEEKKAAKENLEQKEIQYKSLLDALQSRLDSYLKEVRLSSRLTTSPACLVSETTDLSPHLEKLLQAGGQEVQKAKRILELNPNHPILIQLQHLFEEDPEEPRLGDFAEILYGQALLAEGSQPPDPNKFSRLVADLMVTSIESRHNKE